MEYITNNGTYCIWTPNYKIFNDKNSKIMGLCLKLSANALFVLRIYNK